MKVSFNFGCFTKLHFNLTFEEVPTEQQTKKRSKTDPNEKIRWEKEYLRRQQKLDLSNKSKKDYLIEHMRNDALKKTFNTDSSSMKDKGDGQTKNNETCKSCSFIYIVNTSILIMINVLTN